ncbi:putative regulating synaptic membrane exocytosis protein 3, partial [Triplophysa rosa]
MLADLRLLFWGINISPSQLFVALCPSSSPLARLHGYTPAPVVPSGSARPPAHKTNPNNDINYNGKTDSHHHLTTFNDPALLLLAVCRLSPALRPRGSCRTMMLSSSVDVPSPGGMSAVAARNVVRSSSISGAMYSLEKSPSSTGPDNTGQVGNKKRRSSLGAKMVAIVGLSQWSKSTLQLNQQ